MAKRHCPWSDQVDLVSSDDDADVEQGGEAEINQPADMEGFLIKSAKMYQDYMKSVPIPAKRGSSIPCNSWLGLAKSMKDLYKQPLHYLTNSQLKQWDQARFETGDEYKPLDTVIHPTKAEATIWFIEEVNRRTASYHHLSKLWLGDPMYHAFIDPHLP